MVQQVTYSGWTSLEVGHMTQQYDQNFVLYRECNQQSSGLNCKIRIFDLAQSDIRDFLAQGGMCRVVVRGIMCTAPTPEPGWVPTSTRYLHVTWIIRDQEPENLGDDIREAHSSGKQKLQKAMYEVKDEDEDDDDYLEGDDFDEDLGDTELEEEDEEEDEDEEDEDDYMDEEEDEDDEDQASTKQGTPESLNDNNKRPASESKDSGNNKKQKNGMSS